MFPILTQLFDWKQLNYTLIFLFFFVKLYFDSNLKEAMCFYLADKIQPSPGVLELIITCKVIKLSK